MANRLREYRERSQLTQRQLSAITNIGQYVISRLENNKEWAMPGHRKKLAIALSAKEDEIFPDECADAALKAEAKAQKDAKIEKLKSAVFAQTQDDFE